jgi:FtsH-binding integral membrane protein
MADGRTRYVPLSLENELFLREWHNMTDSALPSQRFAERDFSTGQVFNRTFSIMSRNLLPFGLIAAIASLPSALLLTPGVDLIPSDALGGAIAVIGVILMLVLSALSQAVVLYGAFDDMRNRPVNIAESINC